MISHLTVQHRATHWSLHGIAARICANTMVMAFQSEFNGLETGYNEGGQLGFMGFSWDFHGIFMGFSWDFHGMFMGCSWDFHGIFMGFNGGQIGSSIMAGCEICHGGVQFLAGKIIEICHGVVSSHVWWLNGVVFGEMWMIRLLDFCAKATHGHWFIMIYHLSMVSMFIVDIDLRLGLSETKRFLMQSFRGLNHGSGRNQVCQNWRTNLQASWCEFDDRKQVFRIVIFPESKGIVGRISLLIVSVLLSNQDSMVPWQAVRRCLNEPSRSFSGGSRCEVPAILTWKWAKG